MTPTPQGLGQEICFNIWISFWNNWIQILTHVHSYCRQYHSISTIWVINDKVKAKTNTQNNKKQFEWRRIVVQKPIKIKFVFSVIEILLMAGYVSTKYPYRAYLLASTISAAATNYKARALKYYISTQGLPSNTSSQIRRKGGKLWLSRWCMKWGRGVLIQERKKTTHTYVNIGRHKIWKTKNANVTKVSIIFTLCLQ